MNVLVGPGDHVDRHLARLPEPVRGGARDRRRRHAPRAPRDRTAGRIDLDLLRRQVTPATRLIVVNAPHNPTGMLPDRATFDGARGDRRRGRRAPPRSTRSTAASSSMRPIACRPAPTRSRRGISLGVMSKAYAMAGPPDRLAGEPRPRPARPGRRVQGLHDDLLVGAVGDPRDHRVACPRPRARPLARDHRRQPRARSTRSSRTGPTASPGSARGRARSASRG